MFSVNSTVPQVATALAQIPALLNHLRSSNFSKTLSTSSHVPQPNRKDRHASYKTHTAKTVEELIAICNECLDANSIKIVPQHVNKTELLSVCRNNPLRKSFLGLGTSHTSTPTFFENKTGFPESVLRSPFLGQIHLQNLLSPASINSFRLEQRRGFESKKKLHEVAHKDKESKLTKVDLEDVVKNPTKKLYSLLRFFAAVAVAYVLLRIYSATSNGFLMGDFGPKPVKTQTTFDDVQGCYEAKQELIDIVNFLKQPLRFTSVGAKLPKGVLLSGPPGVGKTLLARAVAGEANVAFFQVAGSEFDEVFVGTGAKKLRTLFKVAKSVAPCVIFIDELDSVASSRSNSSLHPYANQTINQLLAEMDGFEPNCGVIVIGATNKSGVLDSAIVRAGRFDVEIKVQVPPYKERVELFDYYLKKPNITIQNDVIVEDLAGNTVGFTGADIENMINQAAIHAAIRNSSIICQEDLEYAREKIQMGPAMKHKIPDENTNRMTAYHEAGHTLVTLFTQNARPLYKVTIQPRGQSLGHTAFTMEKDQYSTSKAQLLANMDVAMGGRVAEEIVFGSDKVSTGAAADFQQATSIARSMVERCGMSEKVGMIVFDEALKPSGAMQDLIDKEVQRLLNESYQRATDLLKKHRDDLNRLSAALLKYEVLSKEDVEAVLAGRKPKAALPTKPRAPSIVETIIFKDKPGQTN